DCRQRRRSLLADEEHSYLPRKDDVLVTTLAFHVVEGDVVVIGDQSLNALDVDWLAIAGGNDVGEEPGRFFRVHGTLVHRRECLHASERTFQLADVALHLVRDEAQDILWNECAVVT